MQTAFIAMLCDSVLAAMLAAFRAPLCLLA